MSQRVVEFAHCKVTIDPGAKHVQTTFDDGASVSAVPAYDRESIARARSLGYQGAEHDAVWQMTTHHDLLHSILAEAEGRPWSPTLHAVAHGYDCMPGEVTREERRVLCVQALLMRGIEQLAMP